MSSNTYGLSIRKEKGYNASGWTYVPVAIIGAGESGIAMGCRLKEILGFDQFRIFERQSGIGGTWYINRYPGVACDIPAIFYSFSFCPNHEWSSFFPSGPEIVRYMQGVCEKYEIVDKIQLNSSVKECVWNVQEKIWELTIQHMALGAGDLSEGQRRQKIQEEGEESVLLGEEKVRAKIVMSGVGVLVEPKEWPSNIPGKDRFKGDIFHSARWRYDVDLRDKDVVVIGTGCSAAQFLPHLTSDEIGAKSVTQLMRSPPWVMPRPIPPLGNKIWEKWSPWLGSHVPLLGKVLRLFVFLYAEKEHTLFGGSEKSETYRKNMERGLLEWMKKTVPEKYHEILTPDYGLGCKRRILDSAWFPGLNDPRVEITTLPLTSVQEHSVTVGPGRTYPDPKDTTKKAPTDQRIIPADTIILANGFEATTWFHPIKVIGKEGKTLHDVFDERGGPQMYLGTAMDGFPNFFAIFGPNTATGHSSVILATENQVEYALKMIKPILNGDADSVEVKKSAEMAYTTDLQRALKDTIWQKGGCNSWYKGADGWNSTVYPYTQYWFGYMCMFPNWKDWDIKYTSQGLMKKRLIALLKYAAYAMLLTGAFKARSAGITLKYIPELVKAFSRVFLLKAAQFLQSLSSRL